jgi:hypothetical protein
MSAKLQFSAGNSELSAYRFHSLRKKSKKQIPGGLKSARYDIYEGLNGTTKVMP